MPYPKGAQKARWQAWHPPLAPPPRRARQLQSGPATRTTATDTQPPTRVTTCRPPAPLYVIRRGSTDPWVIAAPATAAAVGTGPDGKIRDEREGGGRPRAASAPPPPPPPSTSSGNPRGSGAAASTAAAAVDSTLRKVMMTGMSRSRSPRMENSCRCHTPPCGTTVRRHGSAGHGAPKAPMSPLPSANENAIMSYVPYVSGPSHAGTAAAGGRPGGSGETLHTNPTAQGGPGSGLSFPGRPLGLKRPSVLSTPRPSGP
jgi:hypothetical protein